MIIKTLIALFLLNISILSFGQTTTVSKIAEEYIEFGSGGGFAPLYKQYIVTKSGILYAFQTTRLISDSITFQKQICKKQVNKIYTLALKKNIQEYSYDQPGNMYHYIQFNFKNNSNKISWDPNSNMVHPDVIKLYNKLLKILKI